MHCGGVRLTRAELFQADLEVAKTLQVTHRARGILAFEDGVIERSVDEAREAVRVQRGVADVAASEGNQPPGRARATSRTPLRGRDLTR